LASFILKVLPLSKKPSLQSTLGEIVPALERNLYTTNTNKQNNIPIRNVEMKKRFCPLKNSSDFNLTNEFK